MKVLVVDDNEALADLIRDMLERNGIEVTLAIDGIEGYASYLFVKPDLVITDIQMPGGTGFEMMQHIRVHNPMIKTVYMSGNIDAYRLTLEREKQRYPVSFLGKPFSLASLLELVSKHETGLPGEDDAAPCHTSLPQPADGLPAPH